MILQNHRRLTLSIFSVKFAVIGPLKRVVTRRIFITINVPVGFMAWYVRILRGATSLLGA